MKMFNFHICGLEKIRQVTNVSTTKAKALLKLQGKENLVVCDLAKVSSLSEMTWQEWIHQGKISLDRVPATESAEVTLSGLRNELAELKEALKREKRRAQT